MHMHRKKNRTLPPKRGRLITNSEFVSCLLAAEDHRDAGGDVRIAFPRPSTAFTRRFATDNSSKMIHRFAKLRQQMESSALKCSGRTSKELQTVLQDPSAVAPNTSTIICFDTQIRSNAWLVADPYR